MVCFRYIIVNTLHRDNKYNNNNNNNNNNNKIKELMCRDTTNVEREMYDYTASKWSHRNINK